MALDKRCQAGHTCTDNACVHLEKTVPATVRGFHVGYRGWLQDEGLNTDHHIWLMRNPRHVKSGSGRLVEMAFNLTALTAQTLATVS